MGMCDVRQIIQRNTGSEHFDRRARDLALYRPLRLVRGRLFLAALKTIYPYFAERASTAAPALLPMS